VSDINNALNASGNLKLDAQAKKIIANRKFLARILKQYVPEFADISYEDIRDKYIESKIYISEVEVERDRTNPSQEAADVKGNVVSDTIDGIMNEDVTATEGKVTYDVLFKVKCPGKEGRFIEFYVNVEAQAKYNPGYPLETRAIYYAARRFASQFKHISKMTDYGKLEKAYSIWLVMGDTVPKKVSGTVSYYHITKDDVVGRFDQDADIYDKISAIMIRFDEDSEIEDPYLKALQTIFRLKSTKEEKTAAFESQGIELDAELKEEVDDMCNYGSYVAESSRREGHREMITGVIDILREQGFSDRDIAEKLKTKFNLDEKEVDEYLCVKA